MNVYFIFNYNYSLKIMYVIFFMVYFMVYIIGIMVYKYILNINSYFSEMQI